MIKGVFFDIDGTLLSSKDGSLARSTRQAIETLKEKGIKVFVASGRHLCEIQEQPMHDIDFDGYVLLNGQLAFNANRELFYSSPLQVEGLDQLFNEKKYPLVYVEEQALYINYINAYVKRAQNAIATRLPDLGAYKGNPVYQITAFVNEKETIDLMKHLPGCKMTRWNSYGIDIISSVGGKALGIQKLLEAYDISEKEVMAFGDGENDLDMLKYVGIGVAMQNAPDSLKEVSDYVTSTSEMDGISHALEHFGLI